MPHGKFIKRRKILMPSALMAELLYEQQRTKEDDLKIVVFSP